MIQLIELFTAPTGITMPQSQWFHMFCTSNMQFVGSSESSSGYIKASHTEQSEYTVFRLDSQGEGNYRLYSRIHNQYVSGVGSDATGTWPLIAETRDPAWSIFHIEQNSAGLIAFKSTTSSANNAKTPFVGVLGSEARLYIDYSNANLPQVAFIPYLHQ